MKASLNSSETEVVAGFTDAIPRLHGSDIIVINSKVYFVGYDPDVEFDENGNGSWGNGGGYDFLCSIDLNTGEYKNYGSICYVEDEYPAADNSSCAQLRGYYDGKIYIDYAFMKELIEFDSKEEPLNSVDFTVYTFEFDLNTKQYTKRDDLPPSTIVNEKYYLSNENGNATTIITKSGSKTYETQWPLGVFNDKIFYNNGWCSVDDGVMYTLDFDEKYESHKIVGYHNGTYYFAKELFAGEILTLSEEELISASTKEEAE